MATSQVTPEIREYMRSLAKKGAAKGGAARWGNLTAKQRSALGRKLARARWSKLREKAED